jgi:hypothetical protein
LLNINFKEAVQIVRSPLFVWGSVRLGGLEIFNPEELIFLFLVWLILDFLNGQRTKSINLTYFTHFVITE